MEHTNPRRIAHKPDREKEASIYDPLELIDPCSSLVSYLFSIERVKGMMRLVFYPTNCAQRETQDLVEISDHEN